MPRCASAFADRAPAYVALGRAVAEASGQPASRTKPIACRPWPILRMRPGVRREKKPRSRLADHVELPRGTRPDQRPRRHKPIRRAESPSSLPASRRRSPSPFGGADFFPGSHWAAQTEIFAGHRHASNGCCGCRTPDRARGRPDRNARGIPPAHSGLNRPAAAEEYGAGEPRIEDSRFDPLAASIRRGLRSKQPAADNQ